MSSPRARFVPLGRVTHNPTLAISATYGDVDRSADPLDAALWMDRVATYS